MKKSLSLSISILTLCLIALTVFSVSMQRGRAAGSSAIIKSLINGSPQGKVAPTALQTVVLSDDFEGATTFVTANVAATNQWFVGTAAANGGTKGAYVSNDAGVTNAYTLTTTSTNHIYAPITVTAGQSAIVLSFDWKGIDEYDATTDFDYLRVSVSTTLPVGGTFPALADQLPIVFAGQDNYTRAYVNLPASIADGVARFLIFTWRNDSSLGFQPPAAIDNVLVTSQTPAPLSGAKTIPGDYPSIGAAIADVNANGADTSGGSLTFNVAAASTFTETPVALTASGSSASNRIVFQKSGAGANPKITAEGSGNYGPPSSGGVTSASDAVIALNGADFVTFDGIDVASSSVQAISPFCAIEYGYLLRNNNILANVTTINSAQNNIIQNTSITLDRRKTSPASTVGILQTASTATGAGSTPTTAAQANSGNKYYNYTITNAIAGIYLLGNVTFPDLTCEAGVIGAVTQSTIGAATANDIGNASVQTWGIRATNQSGVKIFKNEIRNVTGTSSTAASTVDGIFLDNTGSTATSVGTNEISGNTIHDLNNTNTGASVVAGIRENLTNNAGSVSNIFNDFIYNLNSSSTVTATRRIIGFRVQDSGSGAAATHNIAYNSVRMSPTNVATSNTTFEIGTSTPIFKVQNNVFANFTGAQAGAAKHYCWVSTSASAIGGAGTVSDFNVLHVNNPTNGFTGLGSTTDFATLANWQTIVAGAGPDDNSWAQNPQFISPTNLHIDTALATPVEGHATPLLALTTVDIDGNGRNATTPDIGADEGTFIALLANDIAATAILVPVPGSVVLNGSSVTPQASFTNAGTNNQVSVMVRFTITGPGGYNYTDTQTIATINSGQTLAQTFAAAPAFTTAGTYSMAATNLFADSNAANDQVTGMFAVSDPLAGTLTVGSGGNYASLTNSGGAFEAINTLGATANLMLTITSNLSVETGTVALNEVAGGFTVTIKPSGGARSVSGTSTGSTALIKLNGADGVTIDGSLSGGTDRSLTITNSNTAGVVIWIATNATSGANNNTVKNCSLFGSTGQTTIAGVLAGSGTTFGGAAEFQQNNNTIQNNLINKVQNCAFLSGNAASLDQNWVVSDNTFGSAVVADKMGFRGMLISGAQNMTVTNNSISGINSSTGTSSTMSGIQVSANISGGIISRNQIKDIRQNNTTGWGSNGIYLIAATTSSNLTISNNFISDVASQGFAGVTSTDNGYGIMIDTGGGYKIYHNSVNMNTNQVAAGSITSAVNIAAAVTTSGLTDLSHDTTGSDRRSSTRPTVPTAGSVDLRDNILADTETVGTRYGVYDSSTVGAAVFANIDYNDYFAQNVGFLTSARATLTDWQTATGQDANSKAVDPVFVSSTDFHLQPTSTLLSMGTTPPIVSDDVDSDPRPASNPDIGADELVQAVAGTIPAGTFYNALTADGDSLGGNVSITNIIYLNGKLSTGANTLAIGCNATVSGGGASNYVIGNLKKTYCATGSKSFEVGTANGFSPVTVNVTAGTFPADFTTKAVQGPQPNIAVPAKALQRYWTLTASGVTADLTFNYLDPTDIPMTANEAAFVIFKYNGSFSMPGGTVTSASDSATITGVTSFSDWTLAETGAEPCPISTTPTMQNFPGAGGSNSFTVTADGGCVWNPVPNAVWITIDSVTKPTVGHAGNGTVNYSVAANPGGARNSTITVGVQTFTVTQDTGCSYMLDASSHNFIAPGGSSTVGVTATTGCAWTAVSNDAFIIVDSGTPGSGNGSVGYHVTANTGPMRTGTMTIAGFTFTVTQDAACSFMLSSMSQNFVAAGGMNSVDVIAGTGCAWTAVSNDTFITVNSGTPGSGNGTVGYTVAANVGPGRTGTMTIAGNTFTVTQDSGCTFTLDRDHQSFPGMGGPGTVNVTASDSACPWTASTSATYIHITSGTPGTGNGALNYTVDANPGPTIRSDTITIAGQTYTVYQGIDFLDVPTNHLFYTEIGKLAARGVTLGCTPDHTLYCPNDSVLREQMAAFILRAKGEFSPPIPGSQRFTDVPPENVFYNFIDRLAVLGITVGCNPPTNDMYCPGSAVTREQMSAFILRGLGEFSPPTPASQRFNDVPNTNVFYNFIDRMAVLNITLGCTPDHLFYCPSDPVTRAQMAAFLVRAFDL